jgi:hypothetical protein
LFVTVPDTVAAWARAPAKSVPNARVRKTICVNFIVVKTSWDLCDSVGQGRCESGSNSLTVD